MALFYNLLLSIYYFGVFILLPFKSKARLFLFGRWGSFIKLKKQFTQFRQNQPLLWVHCASLGEFEQGRPVIEKYREQNPNHQILLTFFSPSGYEIRKNYEQADYIYYLPVDFIWNTHYFLKIVKPTTVIFVKYEFWYHVLKQSKKIGAKVYIISAIFRPQQLFFRKIGSFYRKWLQYYDHIFVQNQESLALLQSIGIQHASCVGDTRFDRVISIAEHSTPVPFIEQFISNKKTIVIGSSWEPDEELFQKYKSRNHHQDLRWIIVPHEIHPAHITQLLKRFPDALLWSKQEDFTPNVHTILIVDIIGILSSLYQYAYVAYIGGGFGVGIHNILEAVTYGVPVIFGPNYKKFQEAKDLIERKAAQSITNDEELEMVLEKLLTNQVLYDNITKTNKHYVMENMGSTDKILDFIAKE